MKWWWFFLRRSPQECEDFSLLDVETQCVNRDGVAELFHQIADLQYGWPIPSSSKDTVRVHPDGCDSRIARHLESTGIGHLGDATLAGHVTGWIDQTYICISQVPKVPEIAFY
ncbi:hypothetical protein CDES_09270 [Corynebacterium deserti GIMN1.010]|uniref:Uncharacterized protein n=1 Tax=Corynebacterium deserti GIMN1.010 TaxID=931089 RepID=A0A0M4CJ07_9CORY|nr:hypothetical protein CDES_09270 [Corynebacterium deserti GIMN1.010]